MARVNIEGMIRNLNYNMRRALEHTVEEMKLGANVDAFELHRQFCRSVRLKCGTWVNVPDHFVEQDN